MSSDEQDRPRKTLTIKKTARDARAESEAAPAKAQPQRRPRPPGRPDRARQGKIERLKTPDAPARRWRRRTRPRKPAAARGGAGRADAGRGRRDDGGAPRRAAGARPARAPRDRDNQYVAPATPAGRFYDPFEDDGPAPEFAPEPDRDNEIEYATEARDEPDFHARGRRPREPARPRCSRSSRPAPGSGGSADRGNAGAGL